MVDSKIKIGDVCRELAQGALVQVVDVAASSIPDHREDADYDIATYKSNPLFDPAEDEPVFTCVYLGDSLQSLPSGTYDFPASRLARVPVEEANEDLVHPNHRLMVDLLEGMLQAASGAMEPDHTELVAQIARDAGLLEEVVDEAVELVEAASFTAGGDDAGD